MGYISSASTLTLTSYLTNVGKKIFLGYDKNGHQIRFETNSNNKLIDNFEITHFSLYDSDTNYNSSAILESGDIPEMSGNKNQDLNKGFYEGNTINNKRIKK